jgi:hypothetical protein
MAKVVIILLRVFFAVTLGFLGLIALSQALAMLAFQGFVFFGWPGIALVTGSIVSAGAFYASWRLFKSTLAMPYC